MLMSSHVFACVSFGVNLKCMLAFFSGAGLLAEKANALLSSVVFGIYFVKLSALKSSVFYFSHPLYVALWTAVIYTV